MDYSDTANTPFDSTRPLHLRMSHTNSRTSLTVHHHTCPNNLVLWTVLGYTGGAQNITDGCFTIEMVYMEGLKS